MPSNLGANCIRIAFLSDQTNSQPVIASSRIVFQQERLAVIHGYQNVECAVIIEVSEGHAADSKAV